jgi:uncharacterized phage-associated protein
MFTNLKRKTRNLDQNPLFYAYIFLQLDSEENIDPLKLQKLLYYSYCYSCTQLNETLWEFDNFPIIKYKYGPHMEEVHYYFSGRTICNEQRIQANQKLQSLISQIPEKKIVKQAYEILNIVYNLHKETNGIELCLSTHNECPWMEVDFKSPLNADHIQRQFCRFDYSRQFWAEYIKIFEHMECDIFKEGLYRFLQKISADQALEFCTSSLPKEVFESIPTKVLLAFCVYPKCLVQNYDPIDVLFRRPVVIQRVALAARLGFTQAQHDFLQILSLFGVGDEDEVIDRDPFYKLKHKLMEFFDIDCLEWNRCAVDDWCGISNCFLAGFESFQCGQKAKTKAQRISCYKQAFKDGYYGAAVEIIAQDTSLTDAEQVEYVDRAFSNGMLTVTDMFCKDKDSRWSNLLTYERILDYWKRRGELGDLKGYYLLGQYYHTLGNNQEAEKTFLCCYPFYAYDELAEVRNHDPEKEKELENFFADVLIQFLGLEKKFLLDTDFYIDELTEKL